MGDIWHCAATFKSATCSPQRSISYSQSADLAKALERAHKDYEFMCDRFTGHTFSGKDDIDANQQALRFLSAHLKTSQ